MDTRINRLGSVYGAGQRAFLRGDGGKIILTPFTHEQPRGKELSMDSRRRFVRWQVNQPAKVKLEGAEVFASCAVKDVSLKGLQIFFGIKLTVDTFLRLNLVLADEYAFDVEVWVVWHRAIEGRNVYGLYFTKIKDVDKEKIYQFIRRYFPGQLTQQWWKGTDKGGETMQEEKLKDRRVFARFPVNFGLRYLDLDSNSEGQAQLRDISAKGIGLVANTTLALRTPLEIWLDVPDKGEPFYSRGEVAWSKPVSANECRLGVNLEKADLLGLSRVLRTAQ